MPPLTKVRLSEKDSKKSSDDVPSLTKVGPPRRKSKKRNAEDDSAEQYVCTII
jgi:hypothetical protein